MKTYNRTSVFIAIALILACSLFASAFLSASHAQNLANSQTLEVSPPSQELKGDPGTTVKVKAKVRNKGNTTIAVSARIEDFTASGEGGQVALTDSGPYAISSWTSIEPASFTLKSGESKEVTGTAKIPLGFAGGRYGSFVFSVGGAGGAGAAAVSQEVASLFLLRISGPVTEQLLIDTFTAPSFLEFGPVPMDITFTNKGNVHMKANGLINVRDMFGKTTADIVFRGENVFPDASRKQSVTLEKQWLFGPYTAQAVLTFGSKNESVTATTTFFVFPLRIAVGIGIILGVVYLLRKRLQKALKALIGS